MVRLRISSLPCTHIQNVCRLAAGWSTCSAWIYIPFCRCGPFLQHRGATNWSRPSLHTSGDAECTLISRNVSEPVQSCIAVPHTTEKPVGLLSYYPARLLPARHLPHRSTSMGFVRLPFQTTCLARPSRRGCSYSTGSKASAGGCSTDQLCLQARFPGSPRWCEQSSAG